MAKNGDSAAKRRILIIEDEPALRDIYSIKLQAEGFDVLEAGDGAEGFNAAVREGPNLILLDLVMPVKDGFEVLRDLKLNPKTREIPVIILSNLGQSYEVKRGLDLGAKSFLTKSNMAPDRLVEEIRKVLDSDAAA